MRKAKRRLMALITILVMLLNVAGPYANPGVDMAEEPSTTFEQTDKNTEELADVDLQEESDKVVDDNTEIDADEVVDEDTEIEADEVANEDTEIEADEVADEDTEIEADEESETEADEDAEIEADEVVDEDTEIDVDEVVDEDTEIDVDEIVDEDTEIDVDEIVDLDAEQLIEEEFISLDASENGINISVSGILPIGTRLSVNAISENGSRNYARRIYDDAGVSLGEFIAFDINLIDENGQEIQPSGQVNVQFSGISFIEDAKDVLVYHLEYGDENSQESGSDIRVNEMYANANGDQVSFSTDHFSIYGVGVVATATYNFYIGSTLVDTQIVLNGEKLEEPAAPTKQAGKKFVGWQIAGQSNPINFADSVIVTAANGVNEIYEVHAEFEDVVYIYFLYNGKIIATKEVAPGGTTNSSGIPLIVEEAGQALVHWSTSVNGGEFIFTSPITEDTTLHAVLAPRRKVTFDTQGGSNLLPKYIIDGENLGSVDNPVHAGYTFQRWNSASDGSGDDYTSATAINSDIVLYAIWQADTADYSIIYMLENADDTGYTYQETVIGNGPTDSVVVLSGNQIKSNKYTYFTYKEYEVGKMIKGNGTTIVKVYYSRNEYTIKFDLDRNNAKLIIGGQTYNHPTKYQFTAKYEANISNLWPTASNIDNVGSYKFYGWPSGSSTLVSKRLKLTSDLLPTNLANGSTRTFVGSWKKDLDKYTLHYMIESLDGSGTAFGSKHYNEDMAYSQTANSKGNWNAKQLPGVINVGKEEKNNKHMYFYYDRLSYDLDFYNTTELNKVSNIIYGSSITSQNYMPTRPSGIDPAFVFTGWFTDPGGAGNPFNFTNATMPENNLVLYAKWAPPVYSVKYHLTQGGTDPAQTIGNIEGGTKITIGQLPTLASEGFKGWYWYLDGIFVPYDFNMPIHTNDIVLYPVWDQATYGVSYLANGGIGSVPVDVGNYFQGAAANVLSPDNLAPPAPGKFFIGWQKDGLGRIYYVNDTLIINGNMILVALWGDIIPDAKLIYDSNGGNEAAIERTLKNNARHTVEANSFTKDDHVFIGWNTKADGSGTNFQPGAIIVVSGAASNILFARWKKVTYTIKYLADSNGTISGLTPQVIPHGGSTVAVTAVPNPGYYFVKWDDGNLNPTRNEINVQNNATYTAKFAKINLGLTVNKTADKSTFSAAGQQINYSYVIKNTGNVPLVGPFSVLDDKIATINMSPAPNELAPGASFTATGVYVVTQEDMDAGFVTNHVVAKGKFGNEIVKGEDELTVDATKTPAVAIAKVGTYVDTNGDGKVNVGDSISYVLTVANTGNVTLTNILVKDELLGFEKTIAELAVGVTWSETKVYAITQDDIDAGSVVNTLLVNSPQVPPATVEEETPLKQSPGMSVNKVGNYVDLNQDGKVNVGDSISYVLTVKNTGNITLTNVVITDELLGLEETIAELAVGATWSQTEVYTITQADIDKGLVFNKLVVTSTEVTPDPATETTQLVQSPALRVEKSADKAEFSVAGEVITYSYKLINTGNVTLSGPFTVVDSKIQNVDMSAAPATLAPGDNFVVTGTYSVTQANLDEGFVTNLVTATGIFDGEPVTASDVKIVDAAKAPAMAVTKVGTYVDANEDEVVNVGDEISYTLTVSNTGNITLTNVVITDELLDLVVELEELAVDGVWSQTEVYAITQSDLDAGLVMNTLLVTSEEETPDPVEEITELDQSPAMSVNKVGTYVDLNQDGKVNVGDSISYVLTVKNTGNITLTNAVITDELLDLVVELGELAVGATWSQTEVYEITQADINKGLVFNKLNVTSTEVTPNPATETTELTQTPALRVEKSADKETFSVAGEVITYSYKLINTGNVTLLAPFTVVDSKIQNVDMSTAPATLAPGGNFVVTGTYSVTQANLDEGFVTNLVTATGIFDEEPVTGEDVKIIEATQNPAMAVTKVGTYVDANEDELVNVGDEISYTLTVSNTGNITLTNVVITDELLDLVVELEELAVDGVWSQTEVYTITQADLDAGLVMNTLLVTSEEETPDPVEEITELEQNPALTVNKSANKKEFTAVGEEIIYSYEVRNTGNVTLIAPFTLDDNKIAAIDMTLAPDQLAPGATFTVTAVYAVTQADMDAGFVTNLVIATGIFGEGGVSGEDTVTVPANPPTPVDPTPTDPNPETPTDPDPDPPTPPTLPTPPVVEIEEDEIPLGEIDVEEEPIIIEDDLIPEGTVEDDEEPILIEDELIPQGKVPEEIMIEEDLVPRGTKLPKTGTMPAGMFYGFGSLLVALGFVFNKKRKRR